MQHSALPDRIAMHDAAY